MKTISKLAAALSLGEQVTFEGRVVLQIALLTATRRPIKRRLRDVEMAALEQLRHLAEEERE